MKHTLPSVLLASFFLVCGLVSQATLPPDSAQPETTIQFTATLVSPRDVVVEWKDRAPAAGHIVEWGTSDSPDEEFVPLGYFPEGQGSSYTHPDLMWETNCFYRVRGYYGPATPDIEISLPKDLTDAEYTKRYAEPENFQWAGPVTVQDAKPVAKKSIRDASTAADAAPTDFKITLQPVAVSGFKLTWTDRASDEEGFLIELKAEGSSDYRVVALVEPNINSFGWAFEPPARKAVIRVRAYYLGKPTKLISRLTGKEPAESQFAATTPEPKPPEKTAEIETEPLPKAKE